MQDIITAIRVHINAVDALLTLLDQSQRPQILPPEEPKCPVCNSEVVPRPRTMGSTGRELVCTQCDWQGEVA